VGLPLVADGKAGRNHTLRAGDALATSLLLDAGLDALTREKRPDSDAHDSFPSGHATAAFSLATVESALHPKQAVYWYTGATLIAASRFSLHRHTVGDVLAGAALGYGVGQWEMSSRRGLLLSPWIQPEKRAYGLFLSGRF
jgi:membrane-associated phospholipid phosphatase